ncbi:MAG: hypothetical protein JKY71_06790, partial [Alphaproteobacteria bacterium]|nr:hypothetical protein [Alphaproteobacteria bacterium]
MITKALGLDGVPFVGLIVAGLVFGFGGGLAHDYMTGQGSGNHRPNRARRPRQDHTGETTREEPATPQTHVLATDNPGDPDYDWDAIRANSTNGQFAIQMSMDTDKESFVDLRVLSPSEVTAMGGNAQSIVDQAMAEGRFISNERLEGMRLDSFDKWTFTATETGTIPRPDDEVLVLAHAEGDNDNYVVLELDQPG